jgi:hypothetical protein
MLIRMATRKKSTPKSAAVQPNREQRRREKFHKAGPATHKPDTQWPESRPNPAFGHVGDDHAASTDRLGEDVTGSAGPGTGGPTEGDDRIVDRRGIQPGDNPKG